MRHCTNRCPWTLRQTEEMGIVEGRTYWQQVYYFIFFLLVHFGYLLCEVGKNSGMHGNYGKDVEGRKVIGRG